MVGEGGEVVRRGHGGGEGKVVRSEHGGGREGRW